jgi:hypothetical protein
MSRSIALIHWVSVTSSGLENTRKKYRVRNAHRFEKRAVRELNEKSERSMDHLLRQKALECGINQRSKGYGETVSEMRINTSAFIKLKTNQFGMNLFIKWKR